MIDRVRGVATAAALVAVLAAAGCGPRLLRLPTGAGFPASDGEAAFDEATAACRAAGTFVAEAAVSGRAGGQRLRARLILGLAMPESARLEAYAFGQPVFTFVARGGSATLLLIRERRVLEHNRPADVLEAVTGAPLDGRALRQALLGCAPGDTAGAARAFGDEWRVVADDRHEWYLRRPRTNEPWRLVAAIHRVPGVPPWRAEYRSFERLPKDVRLMSLGSNRFDLRLQLSDIEIDAPLDDTAFTLDVPPGAVPISLEELRASGPLATATDDADR
jgi:hypothetical protein